MRVCVDCIYSVVCGVYKVSYRVINEMLIKMKNNEKKTIFAKKKKCQTSNNNTK